MHPSLCVCRHIGLGGETCKSRYSAQTKDLSRGHMALAEDG
jgi:hypothetical protein